MVRDALDSIVDQTRWSVNGGSFFRTAVGSHVTAVSTGVQCQHNRQQTETQRLLIVKQTISLIHYIIGKIM